MAYKRPPPHRRRRRTFDAANRLSTNDIRTLRSQIPLHNYMNLCNVLITRGFFPKMNQFGEFLDEDDEVTTDPIPQTQRRVHVDKHGNTFEVDEEQTLPAKDRTKLLTDMMRKVLPDARPEDLTLEDPKEAEHKEIEAQLAEMNDHELAAFLEHNPAIAADTDTDVETPTDASVHAPANQPSEHA